MMRLSPVGMVLLCACSGEGAWEPVFFASGIPYMEVYVDDQKTTCLVDTGASGSIVRAGLAEGPITFEFADRSVTESAAIDPLLEDLFVVLSASADTEVGCILGNDIHNDFAVSLDYANERIRFSRPTKKSWEVDGLELGEPIFVPMKAGPLHRIQAEFGPAKVWAAVDTGATNLHLEPPILEAQDPDPVVISSQVSTPDGLLLALTGTLDEMTVKGTTYEDLPFTSYASQQLAAFVDDGVEVEAIIGSVWLENFVVTFNQKREELVLQPY